MRHHPNLAKASRWARKTGRILLGIVLGIGVLFALVVLSLRLPFVQAEVAKRTNTALADLFKGRLVIDRLGSVDLGGVEGLSMHVLDPKGKTVLEARGVDVDLFWLGLVWQAVVQRPEVLTVDIEGISIDHVRARLIDDGTGSPTLAQTFQPGTPPDPKDTGGGTRVLIPDIRLRHAWIHGGLASVPIIDAELHGLKAGLAALPDQTELDFALDQLRARALPAGVDPKGKLTAKLRIPSKEGADSLVRATFDGLLAGGKTTARVVLDGEKLDAHVEARALPPSAITKLTPALAPSGPVAVQADATGTLSAITFKAAVEGAPLHLQSDGTIKTGAATSITANVRARELDLAQLLPAGPPSRLGIDAAAQLDIASSGEMSGTYKVMSAPGTIQQQELPPITIQGDLAIDKDGAIDGKGSVDIAEPGAPATATFALQDVGQPNGYVDLAVDVRLNRPRRLAPIASASGTLSLAGRVRPNQSTVEATAKGDLQSLQAADVRAAKVGLTAGVSGSFDNPQLRADVAISDLGVQGRRFQRANVSANGTLKALDVRADLRGDKPDQIRVQARVVLDPSLLLQNPNVVVRDGEKLNVTISARSVALADAIRVDGLQVRGIGEADGSILWSDGLRKVDLTTRELAPIPLIQALGVETPVTAGALSVRANIEERQRGRPVGSVSGRVDGVRMSELRDGGMKLDLAIAEQKISGALEATTVGTRLHLIVDDVRLPSGGWSPRALERTTGTIAASGRVDLARVEPLLTRFLPIASSRGNVEFDLQLTRSRDDARGAQIAASVNTKNVRLVGRRESERPIQAAETARQTKPWTIEKIDLESQVSLDAGSGNLRLDARLKDEEGPLLTVQASAKPQPGGDVLGAFANDFSRIPIHVRVATPPRALNQLPELLQPKAIRGILAFDAELEGTLADPKLRADANLSCLATPEMKESIDLVLAAEYDRADGEVTATAAKEGRTVGELRARWNGDAMALGEERSPDAPSPVTADVALRLSRFPLDLLPMLSAEQVRGPISGEIKVQGFGKDARVVGKLETQRVMVGTVGVQNFNASVDTQGNQLVGHVEIGGNRGIARAQVRAPMQWGARMTPTIGANIEARLAADNFRLETLSPLVAGQVSELAGRLDANVVAEIQGAKPSVQGWATVRRGVVHMPTIGQRFSDIESRVSIQNGNVKLEQLTARGVSGRLRVDGSAKLDGVEFRAADARVRIDRDDKIPVTVEGSAIGDAWGNIDIAVRASPEKRETRVQVNVPSFTLQMPETNPASLQDLNPPEAIRVGTHMPDGDFVTMPIQPLEDEEGAPAGEPSRTTIEVNLGRSVWIRRGQQLEVQLAGKILVEQAQALDVTGRIDLQGGNLDVQGKRFEIERGTVTFTGGEPTNPTVIAVARWDSPEEYTVYAEYSGTAEEGKLTLRSEPPLTENEILSLLMFGTPDGAFGSGEGGGTAETAVGLAGGTAAQGLNRALSSVTDLDVSARIDTSTGHARPELVVQLTPRVTARLTRAVGEPTTGQSPDRTFFTVDLRLRRAWSLSTTVGDRGASAVDLLWRKRY